METSSRSLRRTYKWVQSRIRELTKSVKVNDNQLDFRCVEDANSIRQEFNEWINAESRNIKNDIDVLFLEYIGKGSEYD